MSDAEALERLPHWARVAFAARCGRACLPLFRSAWPAAEDRLATLLAAVGLAERAAAAGADVAGARAAAVEACMVAGAALMPTTPDPPADRTVASLAAKPAEFAARAAGDGPPGSTGWAAEGYGFAVQAAAEAGMPRIVRGLDADFRRLARAAAAGNWTDGTSVPTDVFGT